MCQVNRGCVLELSNTSVCVIQAQTTSQSKSRHLLALLPKRGPRAFHSFCAALSETEQQHLSRLLMQFVEKDVSWHLHFNHDHTQLH